MGSNESNTKELWGVVRREEAKDLWTRIGTAFENKDGSWNLRMNFVPVDPTTAIQMRDPKSAEEGV